MVLAKVMHPIIIIIKESVSKTFSTFNVFFLVPITPNQSQVFVLYYVVLYYAVLVLHYNWINHYLGL